MRAIIGGPGMLFRFMIAGITAILVMSVMSMAFNFVIAESAGTGAPASGMTGRMIQAGAQSSIAFMTTEILVGMITFFGSLHVMSKK